MSIKLNKIMNHKINSIQNLFKPKNLPTVLLLLFILLLLFYVYKTYFKEGFDLEPAKLEDEIKEGKKLVLFYADWCGHCKKVKPIWDDAAKTVNKEDENKMIKINCGGDSEEEKEIMKKYNIDGYPTILIFENGKPTMYDDERTKESFIKTIS